MTYGAAPWRALRASLSARVPQDRAKGEPVRRHRGPSPLDHGRLSGLESRVDALTSAVGINAAAHLAVPAKLLPPH